MYKLTNKNEIDKKENLIHQWRPLYICIVTKKSHKYLDYIELRSISHNYQILVSYHKLCLMILLFILKK